MRLARLLTVLAPLAVVAGIVALSCDDRSGNPGDGGPDSSQSETVYPACDPDGIAPCPDDWFLCVDEGVTGKHCEGQEPAVPPGGGDWECVVEDGTLVCVGDEMPPEGSDWVCVEYDTDDDGEEEVVCRRHGYFPAGGGEGTWDCYYEGEFVYCDYEEGGGGGDADSDSDGDADSDSDFDADGTGECPPGIEVPTDEVCDDSIDNDCDGRVDEDCGGSHSDCLCIEGAWRYCDSGPYCRWGIQHCLEGGLAWGACNEITDVPAECVGIDGWYSPRAEQCCVVSGYCCHDYWDLDHDGDTDESGGDCTDIVCIEE